MQERNTCQKFIWWILWIYELIYLFVISMPPVYFQNVSTEFYIW